MNNMKREELKELIKECISEVLHESGIINEGPKFIETKKILSQGRYYLNKIKAEARKLGL